MESKKSTYISSKPLKTIGFFSTISEKAKKIMNEIKIIDDWLDTAQLVCTKTDRKTKYGFTKFTFPSKFTLKIYHHDLTLQEAEDDQPELKILINKLSNGYNPKNQIKTKEKEDALKSAKKLFFTRESIISAFRKGIFPYQDGFQAEKESDKEIDTTDMPDLENEKSATEKRNQQGQELKILTPNQMLSRLPISLAQLKAGNNSEKLKNGIRQLLYSLYRSKRLTKIAYNNLINAI